MQHFMSLVGTTVREIVEIPDGLTPGEDIFTPEFAKTLVPFVAGAQIGYEQQKDGSFAAPPDEAPPVSVPASISSAQAKIQLRRAGLRDKVDAAVQAAGGEVLDWFTDARTWERTSPYVLALGTSLKLKPADLDKLFKAAAQISV